MTRTCKDCRWLGDCERDHGARASDPICGGFVPGLPVRKMKD